MFTTPTDKINLNRRKKFGDKFGFFFGNTPVIVISDPKLASLITKKEGHRFQDARLVKPNVRYIADSFLFKSGKAWKSERALVSSVSII